MHSTMSQTYTLLLGPKHRRRLNAYELYELICSHENRETMYGSELGCDHLSFMEQISMSGDPQACQLFGVGCQEEGREDGLHPL